MNRIALPLLGGLVIGFSGCTLAPHYDRPAAPVPEHLPAYSAATPAAPVLLSWRTFVTDEKLRKVVELALANNRDLRLAAQNAELMRATYGIQRATLLPAVTATGSAAKQRAAAELTQPGSPRVTESYSVGLGVLAWEADFFGRLQSLKNEALEKYLASAEARRSAQSLLISSVINTYLSLAADRDLLALSEGTMDAQQKAYDLVRRQYQAGVATELDLRQAQIPLETARGDVARFTRQVAQDENALVLLVGAPVPADFKPAALATVNDFRKVAAGVSSDVLLQRPDVMQAEDQLKAANADIGAARAAFFPRIALTGTMGSGSNELSDLFKSGSDTWSFSPQVSMPIFDARVWTAHRAAKVQREMAVTQYEKAVQKAFREVADALAARATLGRQLAAQQALVEALQQTHRLASQRFEKGIDSYLVVLDAQRSLFAAQQGLVSLRLTNSASVVQLYAALGGGAEDEPTARQ